MDPAPALEVPERHAISPRAARFARVALVGLVLVVAFFAVKSGLVSRLAEPEALGREITALGVWGYVAFVVAFALLQPFGLPGTVFVFAAPLLWPWPVAVALSMTGTMAASVVGFSFARFIGRDFVAKRIPARFRAYDEALAKRAFWTIVALRFVFWMPPLLHAFFGVSKVRFWTHVWGSFVGYFVPLLLVSYFGRKIVDVFAGLDAKAWVGIAVSIVVVGVGVWLVRKLRRGARGGDALDAATTEKAGASSSDAQ